MENKNNQPMQGQPDGRTERGEGGWTVDVTVEKLTETRRDRTCMALNSAAALTGGSIFRIRGSIEWSGIHQDSAPFHVYENPQSNSFDSSFGA